MQDRNGFSLVELMIVVAIIAVLASIAIPSYRHYVVRAHRTDARRALLELAGRQERYFYAHHTYADKVEALSGSGLVDSGLYTVEVSVATSTDYTLTATAVGTQQRDDASCQTLVLNRSGERGSSGTVQNDPRCWEG